MMISFIRNNLKNIIVISFIIPILLVAFVSISHVAHFYEMSNPVSWAMYLSVAIEIAAISALAGLTVRMGNFIYIPFGIVTFVQFIGNMYFAYTYINENSQMFLDWIAMVSFILEPMGVESTDIASHKTILALFSGGLLPVISLTFAHMLVVFNNQNVQDNENTIDNNNDLGETNQVTEQVDVSVDDVDLIKQRDILNKLIKDKFGEVKVVNPKDNPEIVPVKREVVSGDTQTVAQLMESEADKLVKDENQKGWEKPVGSKSGDTQQPIKRVYYTKPNGKD